MGGGKVKKNTQNDIQENNVPEVENEEVKTSQEEKEVKTYTQSELDSLISRSVENALKKREKQYEKDLKDIKTQAYEDGKADATLTESENK